jgi:hypothetical protein
MTTDYFKKILPAVLCLLLFSTWPTKAQNIYDAQHAWEYAQHLYRQKAYVAAAEEYLRVLNRQAHNTEALDSAISALTKAGKYEQTVSLLNNHFSADEIPDKYRDILITEALRTEQFTIAQKHITAMKDSFPTKAAAYKNAQFILAGAYKKTTAFKFESKSNTLLQLKNLADSCQNIRFKRPAFYAISAAIIPGSGHMASGNSEMGMQYLFMFAANGFQAYKAYEIKGKGDKYAFVFTGIAAGIYLGNIYGAYREAQYRNNQTKEVIKRQVIQIIKQTGK